jgi:hypothetical protein
MSAHDDWLRPVRDCIGDAICTHLRDNSRPLSAWIADALVEGGFLSAPATRAAHEQPSELVS